MIKLELFQIEGANFLASRFHAANSDAPGLGKSYQAIHAAHLVNAKHVFGACPDSVRASWQEHIESYSGPTRGWDVISYNAAASGVAEEVLRGKYDVII